MKVVNRVRGIILNDGKLFAVKHKADTPHFCLPGGHLENGETLEKAMAREILEETGVRAQVGKLLCVHELIDPSREIHSIEFFFYIRNGSDFAAIDRNKASHEEEIFDYKFLDPFDPTEVIKPSFSLDLAKKIIESGEDGVPTTIYTRNGE